MFSDRRTFHRVSPERVVSGVGSLKAVPGLTDRLGTRVLVATSRSLQDRTPLVADLLDRLGPRVAAVFSDCRQHAPSVTIDGLTKEGSASGADVVVALGGSSVFDAVKVTASQIGAQRGQPPLPSIAIPTTLSAGEFNPSAGFTDAATHTKRYVFDLGMLPRAVVLDPEVTAHTPIALWLSTGVKAIDHAMEAVWTDRGAHPVVETLALEALRLLVEHLPASADPTDLEARAACQIAAWMSIAGVSTHGLRLSHLLGHQVGAYWDIAHGVTSCILLPTVMRHLAPATPDAQRLIAGAMGVPVDRLDNADAAAAAADVLEALVARLGLPTGIGAAGGRLEDIEEVAEASMEAARSLGLLADLPNGAASVRGLLLRAWGPQSTAITGRDSAL